MTWANDKFLLPGASWSFRPKQAEALWVIHKMNGLLAPIGVGFGKTLISYLAQAALGVDNAIIMMPPGSLPGYKTEVEKYIKSFNRGPGRTQVVPYSVLSQPTSSRLLEDIAPDAIICDEAHCLSDPTAARTSRFLAYMARHPDTLFVGMSGTLYRKSITDVAHLAALALRSGSPVPRPGSEDLNSWSRILDTKGWAEAHEYAWFESSFVRKVGVDPGTYGKVNRARSAAYRRLVSCPGVVTTEEASCTVSLTLNKVPIEPPASVLDKIAEVKATRTSPDGEDFYEEDSRLFGAMRNLACGFYYKFDWAAVGGRNEDWIIARRAWLRALTKELFQNKAMSYDSPKLVSAKVDSDLEADHDLVTSSFLHFARGEWNKVKHLPEPPRVTVWVDTYLIDYVKANYLGRPELVWYDSQAIGEGLSGAGFDVYGAGTDLTGPERSAAASIGAHGTGRNLQDWHKAVVVEPCMSGHIWEQLLGRLHRGGQERNVTFDLLIPGDLFNNSIDSAKADAKFIQSMSGGPQRLLTATWT